jgi:signal transduction histidine kinase
MTTNGARYANAGTVGWLVARGDGTIIAADDVLCSLMGIAGPSALLERPWTSLVSPADAWQIAHVEQAGASGRPWKGRLSLRGGGGDRLLDVEVFGAGGVMVLRAGPPGSSAALVPGLVGVSSTSRDLDALLTATDAAEEATDAAAAARAVLQAIHSVLAFDWAVTLRYLDLDGTSGAGGAEVLATYPGGMAGVQRGVRWTTLDEPERVVLESGEPALEGALVRRSNEHSPLARLNAFGMRSRLQIPIYAGGRVRGCVSFYSAALDAYSPAEGVRAERLVRPLRVHFEPTADTATGGHTRSIGPSMGSTSPADEGQAELQGFENPPAVAADLAAPPVPPERSRWEPGPRDRSEIVEQRLGALGEMVSGVAHELNNPLTAILGYAQILPSLEGTDRDQALATIEQEALRASRIVRNLLAFARQHRTSVQPVDVEAVLRRVVEVRRYSLHADNVAVDSDFGGLPLVMADEYQLEQVFLNLLNNAHQAMLPQGGIVTISTRRVNDHARITIADTGPGVPDEVADRIFEPFFTTRDVGSGVGLGLAIVYGIVAEHAGHVWVEHAPSGGAQFVVELPLAHEPVLEPAQIQVEPPTGSPTDPSESCGRLLVVDDELPIRALMNEILGAAGYDVDTAASGEEALRLLESGRYDAVLVDMDLPGITGDALYRVISDRWPALREHTLFVSGDPETDREAELLSELGASHLEKPFDAQTLLLVVRDLLKKPAP